MPSLIDGESFEGLVFNLHYDSELVTYLPMFITQVANQEYEVFKVLASFTVFQDSISEGMYNATMCSEEIIPQPDEILIPRNPIVPVDAEMVASDIQWYTETCASAAVPALDANVNKAFTTDTPTLLLSGRYDPITPASMGDTVVAGLANATHVVLPNAAHGAFIDNKIIGAAFAFPATNDGLSSSLTYDRSFSRVSRQRCWLCFKD